MDQSVAELVRRHLTAENAQDLKGTRQIGVEPIPALRALPQRENTIALSRIEP